MTDTTPHWDHEVDLLVFGAGMGGMSAALVGAHEGLRVLLCEKTGQVGGTTATSAGTLWIPGTGLEGAAAEDDIAQAAIYLDAETGNRGDGAMRAAFLQSGREALEYLQRHTEVKLRPVSPHPDYHPATPGWSMKGRAVAPLPFDGRRLGRDFALVRPPIEPFMVLGGLMIGRDDIPHFLDPFGSRRSFLHVARILLRHFADRLTRGRGARLLMGNALVARLLFSLRTKGVPIWLNCRLIELVGDGSRVDGAVVELGHERLRVRASRGVMLATGGFATSEALRKEWFKSLPVRHTMGFWGNSGDGISAARAIGASAGDGEQGPAFWFPSSILHEKGKETIFPHIVLDRAKPGLIAVNSAGTRFVNEADSYHDFVEAMFRAHATVPSIPAHLICDRSFIRDYGIGLVHPASPDAAIRRFVRAGYLKQGATLAELAAKIGVPADRFERTVAEHNRFAESGVDEAFGKGSNPLNRHNGDPANKPNPCLRPIAQPPFFSVAVYPADLGTSTGLRTDIDARVLTAQDTPIAGLYACGNDMNSIMAGAYPGPGTTLGPALVFAYRAVMHMRGGPAMAR
ncbi:MAG TPA: FAD-binding protein [Pseudorhodoplanes sp.]|jgi:succinate dehydrogenase/fumarate reductase flavoprotein subunit|nr:FAD-binding protein [Pseudorhodoplanes sp.]